MNQASPARSARARAERAVRGLLARHGMADNAVLPEGGARYVCAPGAPGKRRRCVFVKDGHRSNRGYVVLRAVGPGAPPAAVYRCFSGRCRGRHHVLGSVTVDASSSSAR